MAAIKRRFTIDDLIRRDGYEPGGRRPVRWKVVWKPGTITMNYQHSRDNIHWTDLKLPGVSQRFIKVFYKPNPTFKSSAWIERPTGIKKRKGLAYSQPKGKQQ